MSRLAAPPGRGGLSSGRVFRLVLLQVALVGATAGVERAVLPLLADGEFAVASTAATVAFIAAFGIAKAPMNLLAGRLADSFGRRHVLVAGWLVAAPVPLVVALAPAWEWVVAVNVLLGAQQGICWSTAIFMHVDLATPRRRGLAIGLNELFGYGGAAILAYAGGWIAAGLGPRPAPFVLQALLIAAGLATALRLVPETRRPGVRAAVGIAGAARSRARFAGICQAGLVTKVADVVAWGILPVHLIDRGVSPEAVGAVAAAYPAVWAVLQPFTGAFSDRAGRRLPAAAGLLCQGAGLLALAAADSLAGWLGGVAILGAGTALAYPVLMAAAGDEAPGERRASAIGLYRFWRDLGFVAGALLGGLLADEIGTPATLQVLAALAAVTALPAAAALRGRRTAARRRVPSPSTAR